MDSETQRSLLVVLLTLSCIAAVVLLWSVEPVTPKKLQSSSQLDSLITLTLRELNVDDQQVRVRTVEVDSIFSRQNYLVSVAPNFSKTTLHYTLHHYLWDYGVQTFANVSFPERDMKIHLLYNNTIHRSIDIRSDRDLMLRQKQPIILPDLDSHEVD